MGHGPLHMGMALIRFLIFDKKYRCRLDTHDQKHGTTKATAPATAQPGHASTAMQSTYTVHAAIRDTPDISALSIQSPPPPKHTSSADDSRLIMGACYSLRSLLSKLAPHGPGAGFSWDCPNHRLLYYHTPTGCKFVAIVSGGGDWKRLREYYEKVFVPYICRSPLVRLDDDWGHDDAAFMQATISFFNV